jgi:hypothetical protein
LKYNAELTPQRRPYIPAPKTDTETATTLGTIMGKRRRGEDLTIEEQETATQFFVDADTELLNRPDSSNGEEQGQSNRRQFKVIKADPPYYPAGDNGVPDLVALS